MKEKNGERLSLAKMNRIKCLGRRTIFLTVLLSFLFLLTGCPPADETYSIAQEQYLIGWILHNVNESTNTTLDYSFDELAIYNYTFNYPAHEPQAYSNVLFWLKPIHEYGSGMAAASWNEIDVPVDKVYYLKGENPVPENYKSNWSLANYMHINYLFSDNLDEQFGLEVAHEEHYNSEDAWYSITPIPGDKKHIYFGTAPFTPASVIIKDNYIRLNTRLMKGHNGLSYLKRYTVIGAGTAMIRLEPPKYEIYKDSSLIEAKNITAPLVPPYYDLSYWDYTQLNYYLEQDGNYTVNITIPTLYPIFNLTLISASFKKPSSDMNPPELNHIDISPRFKINRTLNISINMSDDSGISAFELFYSTDMNESWKNLTISGSDVYSSSLEINDSSVQEINLKFKAIDDYNNSASYIIKPVSLRERTINLNFTSDKSSAVRGESVEVRGTCKDNLDLRCGGLRLEYYLNGKYMKADRTEFEFVEEFGEFPSIDEFVDSIIIPYNLSEAEANISVLFKGSGVYGEKTEEISIDILSYEHDLAVDDLTLSEFRLNRQGTINTTLYNIGLNDEENITVNLIINNNIIDNITVSRLNVSNSEKIGFNWTPTESYIYNITVSASPVAGETYLANNQKSSSITLGPDIEVDLILPKWLYKLNETINARIDYENTGNENAANLTAYLYDMYEFEYVDGHYDETRFEYFNNTDYYITASRIDNTHIKVNISYDSISEELILFRNQIVELKNGIFLDVDWIDVSYCGLFLSKADIISKNLSDLAAGESRTDYLNWTTDELGEHRLKLFINASEDSNWINNYAFSYISVKLDAPDISLYVDVDSNLPVNETANITLYMYNEGTKNAANLTAYLYDMYEYQDIYAPYDEKRVEYFNDTEYNITASRIDDDYIKVNISYDSISEEFILFRNQIVELKNGIFLNADYVYSFSSILYLGKADVISKNLPDLDVQGSKIDYLNWTPDELGQHRLIVFVNASEDSNWKNNYYYELVNVKIDAPDISVWLDLDYYLPVNETANATIYVENTGFRNATNVTANFYDMYEQGSTCFGFNQTMVFYFNDTGYNITGYKIDAQTARINVTYNDVSEEFILFINQFVKLENEIFLELDWISESEEEDYYCFYLEKGIKHEKFLGNVSVNEEIEFQINWTPRTLGEHKIKIFVNTTDDGDWTNNYYYYYVQAKIDAPDLEGWIYWIQSLIANKTNEIEYAVHNSGLQNAANVTAELFYKYDDEENYTLIDSKFIGEVKPDEYISEEFNWIPIEEGYVMLKLILNSSEDGNLDNNIDFRYVLIIVDFDGDGIEDKDDTLVGNQGDINSTLNITVFLDDSTDISGNFKGIKEVIFKSDNESIVEFDFDFDNYQLVLPNIKIEAESAQSSKGYLLVSGINLAEQNRTKTVYVNRIAGTDNLCIKDAEITYITEISSNCNGANEFSVNCPGTGAYNCTIAGDRYKIDGLHYSGAIEYTPAMPPAAPPVPSGGARPGCPPIWNCTEWSECSPEGIQTRFCIDTGPCNFANRTQTQSCEYIPEEVMPKIIEPEIVPEEEIIEEEIEEIIEKPIIEERPPVEEKERKWLAYLFIVLAVLILCGISAGYYAVRAYSLKQARLLEEINKIISEAHDLIKKKDINELKIKYGMIKGKYDKLSIKNSNKIYEDIMILYDKMTSSVG